MIATVSQDHTDAQRRRAGAHASDFASQTLIFAGLVVVTTVLWLFGVRRRQSSLS